VRTKVESETREGGREKERWRCHAGTKRGALAWLRVRSIVRSLFGLCRVSANRGGAGAKILPTRDGARVYRRRRAAITPRLALLPPPRHTLTAQRCTSASFPSTRAHNPSLRDRQTQREREREREREHSNATSLLPSDTSPRFPLRLPSRHNTRPHTRARYGRVALCGGHRRARLRGRAQGAGRGDRAGCWRTRGRDRAPGPDARQPRRVQPEAWAGAPGGQGA